jgi:hypothetical protein
MNIYLLKASAMAVNSAQPFTVGVYVSKEIAESDLAKLKRLSLSPSYPLCGYQIDLVETVDKLPEMKQVKTCEECGSVDLVYRADDRAGHSGLVCQECLHLNDNN